MGKGFHVHRVVLVLVAERTGAVALATLVHKAVALVTLVHKVRVEHTLEEQAETDRT